VVAPAQVDTHMPTGAHLERARARAHTYPTLPTHTQPTPNPPTPTEPHITTPTPGPWQERCKDRAEEVTHVAVSIQDWGTQVVFVSEN
jgi:hypothetical protein